MLSNFSILKLSFVSNHILVLAGHFWDDALILIQVVVSQVITNVLVLPSLLLLLF